MRSLLAVLSLLLLALPAMPAHAQLPSGGLIVGTNGTPIQNGTPSDCLTVGSNGRLSQTSSCGSASGLTVGASTVSGGTASGILWNNGGVLGGGAATMTAGGSINLPSGQVLSINGDTGISRNAAATFLFGNGTQGSTSGILEGTAYISIGGSFSWNASTKIQNPPANGKLFITNAAATAGNVFDFTTDGTFALYKRDGTTAGIYASGTSVGVTCSGTPTSSFASTNGIVTHC